MSDGDILEAYPMLALADLDAASAYIEGHRDEIDRLIRENDEA